MVASGAVDLVSAAQSRGEWPGERTTFREGRLDGARVEVVGASAGCIEVFDNFFCVGTRRLDIAEGGGIKDEVRPVVLVRSEGASVDFVAGFRRGGLIVRDGEDKAGGGMDCSRVWALISIFGGEVAATDCVRRLIVSRSLL